MMLKAKDPKEMIGMSKYYMADGGNRERSAYGIGTNKMELEFLLQNYTKPNDPNPGDTAKLIHNDCCERLY